MTNEHAFFQALPSKIQGCIADAYKLSIGFYNGDTLSTIQGWRLQLSGMTSLYSLFRSNELASFSEGIFSNQIIRDFVLKLSINFHARFDMNEGQDYIAMIRMFASSIDQHARFTENDKELCLIPEQLLSRLPTMADIESTLSGNKWLVTLVAMVVFIPAVFDKTTEASKA